MNAENDLSDICSEYIYCSLDNCEQIIGYCLEDFIFVCQACPCYSKHPERVIKLDVLGEKYGCLVPCSRVRTTNLIEIRSSVVGNGYSGLIYNQEKIDNERKYAECEKLSEEFSGDLGRAADCLDNELGKIDRFRNKLRNIGDIISRSKRYSTNMELKKILNRFSEALRKAHSRVEKLGRYIGEDYPNIVIQHNEYQAEKRRLTTKNLIHQCVEGIDDGKGLVNSGGSYAEIAFIAHNLEKILKGTYKIQKYPRVISKFTAFNCCEEVKELPRTLYGKKIDSYQGGKIEFRGRSTACSLKSSWLRNCMIISISHLGYVVMADSRRDLKIINMSVRNFTLSLLFTPVTIINRKYDITSIGFKKDKMIFSVKNDNIYVVDFFDMMACGNLGGACPLMKEETIVDWCDMSKLDETGEIYFGNKFKELCVLNVDTGLVEKLRSEGKTINAIYTIPITNIDIPGVKCIFVREDDFVYDYNSSNEKRFHIFCLNSVNRVFRDDDGKEVEVTDNDVVEICDISGPPLCFLPSEKKIESLEDGAFLYFNKGVLSFYRNNKIELIPNTIKLLGILPMARIYKNVFLMYDVAEGPDKLILARIVFL